MHKTDIPSGAHFHERLASRWHQGYASGGFRRRLDFIESRLAPLVGPGSRWLDAGCGAGTLTQTLARLGAQGEAVDGSPAMIAAARQMGGDCSSGPFQFRVVHTVESLPYPDESFDGVLCSSVLEYLERPGAALSEFARVLRPGGRLLLTAARTGSAVRTVQVVVRRVAALAGRNAFEYLTVSRHTCGPGGLRRAVEAAAMRVDAIEPFDPVMPPWLQSVLPSSLLAVTATRPA
ncbi:MAG: class I SAM-dependent methyltransferase [Rubrivivax sp.]|nr:class I SAM-dependent methyltransferase [Rubrivivax sp.]